MQSYHPLDCCCPHLCQNRALELYEDVPTESQHCDNVDDDDDDAEGPEARRWLVPEEGIKHFRVRLSNVEVCSGRLWHHHMNPQNMSVNDIETQSG